MKFWGWAGTGAAAVALTLSVINASWIAPRSKGPLILVAHRALGQPVDRSQDGCPARHVLASEHDFIENSLRSVSNARHFGADAIAIDVQRTRDGQMVAFADAVLECRTDGRGAVAAHSLAELKRLDIGYGYTADGGRTFPLRGRGVGGMPTVEEVLREAPRMRMFLDIKGRDPAGADALVAAFRSAGVEIDGKFGFHGDPAVIERLRRLAPAAWTWDEARSRACLDDYVKLGWTSFVPASCRNATLVIPIDRQWMIWGWPKRFLARMGGAGTKVILVGSLEGGAIAGLERPEQLGDVPRDFRGYLWIEDFYAVGRALER